MALVGAGRRVLELGCGTGHVTRKLTAQGCSVTGVEIDLDAARMAAEFTERVHVADLDRMELSTILGDARFERIVVGDVLEHLADPAATLAALRAHLTQGGFLVASIPNVTHADVRLMLLGGHWQYQDHGLLDRTHIRFFDLDGVLGLFGAAGWRIVRLERTTKGALQSELADLAEAATAMPGVLESIEADPEASTYQFVVIATPGDPFADAPERFGINGTATGGDGALGSRRPTDRLLSENERLRVKVRELEEMLEDAHWSRAIWRRRLGRVGLMPQSVYQGLRKRFLTEGR